MPRSRPRELLSLARKAAAKIPDFQAKLGPGSGDLATHSFMRVLRGTAIERFGNDFSEKKLCGKTALAVDFYFPEEATIVEVSLGLPNPGSEYEKDILRALMAQELGCRVRTLLFISRAGAAKKCRQPGRTAVKNWAKANHQLSIEVHDLPGEPRRRYKRQSPKTLAQP